ncbi:GGDEF domain-containing protein [Pseudomonas coronafaciens pv. atropurpurea]|nr:GGDEF domain-containing protein [Pseudomonas coronafaciens pv. atropurpurea]
MSFTRDPRTVRKYLYTVLWLYLFSLFLLAVVWEFKLEALAMYTMNLPYDSDFENAERWRFVLTSTGFALLSMVVPFILLKLLMQRLQGSYNDLLASQTLSDSLARHDPLSGLLNRRVFHEQLVARLQETSMQTAVFLIDLDKFKLINDTHGHAVGDAAICAVAESLREATAGLQASVARLGGDEFGLAVSGNFSQVELATLAESVLSKLQRPGQVCHVWPSVLLWALPFRHWTVQMQTSCCSVPTARCIEARAAAETRVTSTRSVLSANNACRSYSRRN